MGAPDAVDASPGYSIRGGDEGKARLDILAEALRPTTTALLEEVQKLVDDVRLFASDKCSVVSYPRFFQVWGRR